MFPAGVLQGDELTPVTAHQALGRAKDHVELVVAMTAFEVPLRAGLLHPDRLARLLVTVEPIGKSDKYQMEKQPDGSLKRKITGLRVVQNVRPVHTEMVGMDAVAACKHLFLEALGADAQAAGELLDKVLPELFAEYMRTGEQPT